MRLGRHKRGQSKYPPTTGAPGSKAAHPALAKLAVALREYTQLAEQHAATAEILRVIAKSPSDAQSVFDAIVKSAKRLMDAHSASVSLLINGALHLQAWTTTGGSGDATLKKVFPMKVAGGTATPAQAVRSGKPVFVADTELAYGGAQRQMTRARGYRSVLSVPLVRDKAVSGAITVTRREPGSFTKRQIGLLETFADQAVIAIENARLFRETREALGRQTATSEILKVISASPTATQPVFEAIVKNCHSLFHDSRVALWEVSQGQLLPRASTAYFPEPMPLDRASGIGACVLETRTIHLPDLRAGAETYPRIRQLGLKHGYLSGVYAPLLRNGRAVGAISLLRRQAGAFREKEVALLSTFADQAVIAIENARLFNETKEALERQTATADILKVISSSPTDTQPVFSAIVDATNRLIAGKRGGILLRDGDHFVALAFNFEGFEKIPEEVRRVPLDREKNFPSRAILDGQVVHIPDWQADEVPEFEKQVASHYGVRSGLIVPLMRKGEGIGALAVARETAGPYHEKEIALLRSFTDQAVIAIENVRLFNETKESLEQQTAISEVLRVISDSPTDVKPVLDAVAARAAKICDATDARIFLTAGNELHHAAGFGDVPVRTDAFPLSRGSASGRAIIDREPVQIPDIQAQAAEFPVAQEIAERSGYRTVLAVPLLREGGALGAIGLRRKDVRPFTDKQIALLKTFADQAAIAIENVRLFNETKAALERQTATSEILRVISSSPNDVQPVFDTIVRNFVSLCGGVVGAVFRYEGGLVQYAGSAGFTPEQRERVRAKYPVRVDDPSVISARTILTRAPIHVQDTLTDSQYDRDHAATAGWRRMLAVPMLREGEPVGAIVAAWREPGATPKQHEDLLKLFADQAVIAIENVRLFNETKEALERQTATAEILKVIASSPSDVQPVFDAIASSAMRLVGGFSAAVVSVEGEALQLAAFTTTSGSGDEALKGLFPLPISAQNNVSTAIRTGAPRVTADVENDPEISEMARTAARARGWRAGVAVPMLREGQAVGAINVTRREPGPFADAHVKLLQTFADQAVIAIENVRLFKELQSRTEALSNSVQQLTALGDVGRAISATLELDKVLQTVVTRAVQLTNLDGGAIYEYDAAAEVYNLKASERFPEEFIETVRRTPIRKGEGATGRTAVTLEPVQVPDILDHAYQGNRREMLLQAGYRAILAVPLLREENLVGALMVMRKTAGEFAPAVIELLKTFAVQSALAIQNARLYREIEQKSRELETASRHKSQFLASMSHELRTPLNAILGFNEMILDGIYGDLTPDIKAPLENIQSSGKHLLRLINNVLDLAKIEAGRMELALGDYSVQDTVSSVHSTLKPLAAEKGLEFVAEVPADIPPAHGDAGRLAQCLMNLAGNSLKFTKQGRVAIGVAQDDDLLRFSVADTGIGIPADKIDSLFTEFKQTDATIASEYGGTGLGLSITKKFIEMHGGRIWVESEPGKGSTFRFEIPLRVAQ